jgi:uncharacterized protein YjbJ (UPF0337 family)
MGKDSSEIRREIEQTRARMGDTVEALSYKADVPARVKDAVSDRVETVKGSISDVVGSVKDALGGAKRTVTDTISSAGDAVGGATGRVGDATTNVTTTMSDTLGSVTEKIPSAAEVKDVARRGVGIAVENPLGLGLGALAVGLLAGLLTPVTDYERKTVGPIRDDLVDRAQSVGSDVLDHGKQVIADTVHSAIQTAQQSAQTHSQQVIGEATGNGESSSQYGVLLDDREALEPGTPGTAAP